MKKQGRTKGWNLTVDGMPKLKKRSMIPVLVSLIDVDGQPQTTIMVTDGKVFMNLFLHPFSVTCEEEKIIAWQYYPLPYGCE